VQLSGRATITGPSFSAGILRDRLPGSAPISLQRFKLAMIQGEANPSHWSFPLEEVDIN